MKTQFETLVTNEFGIGRDKRTGKVFETAEETFRKFLNKLPQRILKSWESIEFEFEGKLIEVCKSHLIETDFDFENSHTITEL